MTKSYSILHAKVHELESTLDDLLLLGPDTETHHFQSKESIKQKLDFIWNLFNAEVASHPSKPHHLLHISQRLEAIDKILQQWDTNTSPTLIPYQDDFDDDKDSTCSCTESCFNDDGEAFVDFVGDKALVEFNGGDKETIDNIQSFVFEDAEQCFEDFDDGGDKELVEYKRDDDKLTREDRRDGEFGSKCCRALVGGVVIGMVFMGFIMSNLSDCFFYIDQTSFPIPT